MSSTTRKAKPLISEEKLPPSFRRAKPVVLPQKGYNEYSESELVDQFTPMVIKWVHRLAYHPSLKQEIDDLRNIGLTALINRRRVLRRTGARSTSCPCRATPGFLRRTRCPPRTAGRGSGHGRRVLDAAELFACAHATSARPVAGLEAGLESQGT